MNSPIKKSGLDFTTLPSHQTLRWRSLVMVPLVVAFGLACKLYRGPGSNLINNFGPASIAYVVLLALLMFAIKPKREKIVPIILVAFVLTCVIEFMQLWQPEWLTMVRSTVLGRLILGTTFNLLDFPAYLIGAIVSGLILRTLCHCVRTAR